MITYSTTSYPAIPFVMALYLILGLPVFLMVLAGLSFYTTENGLSEAFSQYGQVIEGTSV